MAGKTQASQHGMSLEDRVAKLAESLGLKVERKVKVGYRLWGRRREIDLVLRKPNSEKILGVECKYQSVSGTAEEKILAVLEDMKHWPIPGLLVIDGQGFSEAMRAYLLSTGKVWRISGFGDLVAFILRAGRVRSTMAAIPRPFLKWAGGKGRLLPVLLRNVPARFNTYFEPFLGGGALFFALWRLGRIRRAVLSDINRELMDTYRAIQEDVESVIRILDSYPYSRSFYYRLRAQDPWTLSLPERAARMIYLNKTGYNGLYRVNKQGRFNVPFGRYKHPNYKDFANLRAVAQALRRAELVCSSFEFVVNAAQAGDFVYFDPPYDPLSDTASFTQYHAHGFTREDHVHLAQVFRDLSRRGVWVMLSNSDTPFIRDLYRDFHMIEVQTSRPINSRAERRKHWRELLILNFTPRPQQFVLFPQDDAQRAKREHCP